MALPPPAPAPAPRTRAGAAGRSLRTGLSPATAADLHIRHLELRERRPDLAACSGTACSSTGISARIDSIAIRTCVGIALVFGVRGEAGAHHPDVDHGHDVLDQHVLDAQSLELGLVGPRSSSSDGAPAPPPRIGIGTVLMRSPPHRVTSTVLGAYVSRVSATVAA